MSSLSETLQEKAKNELGEKVEWRDRDIQALRDLLKSDLGNINIYSVNMYRLYA